MSLQAESRWWSQQDLQPPHILGSFGLSGEILFVITVEPR